MKQREHRKTEEIMSKSRLGLGVVILTACFISVGCGGSSENVKTEDNAKSVDPFGVGSVDLREGAEADEEEDFDPEDLEVPGTEYGMKKGDGGGKVKTNCPKGKKGKKCRAKAKKMHGAIPKSEAISGQMEGIPWGMHYKAVMANFEKRIKKEYEEELKNANGAVEEYEVRTKMNREIAKLKKSYVQFDGSRTGYEGAVLEGEFTHNNNESMLEWDAGKFVEYLFFFNGRFWKRLRTFRKEALKIPDFQTYITTLEQNFGDGRHGNNSDGELMEVQWKNDDTYMIAKDKSHFYGVFCLYFIARVTEDNLAKLRPNQDRDDGSVKAGVSDMVESVTSGDLADHNSAVIDSYTGDNVGTTPKIDAADSVMGKTGKASGTSNGGKKGKKKKAPPKDEGSADIF
jgi:hypothetical protein